jgi:hypothetical protein
MSDSCKICVLPRPPETVAYRRFHMHRADRAWVTVDTPRSVQGILQGLCDKHGSSDVTPCHTTGQYVTIFKVAEVCLILLDSWTHHPTKPFGTK